MNERMIRKTMEEEYSRLGKNDWRHPGMENDIPTHTKVWVQYFWTNHFKLLNAEVAFTFINYLVTTFQKNKKGLFVSGDTGIGKTFGMQVIAKAFKIPIIHCGDLSDKFKGANESERVSIINSVGKSRGNIILDDLDVEDRITTYGDDFELMEKIIFHRNIMFIRHGSRTMFTSNRPISDLAITDTNKRIRYDARTISRLVAICDFKHTIGEDLRFNDAETL